MNRRTLLIGGVSLGLLLSVTVVLTLAFDDCGNNVTVSFAGSEISNGVFPAYERSERFAVFVRNDESEPVSFNVREIEDEHRVWIPSVHVLGHVEPGHCAQFYLYLPPESHPRGLKIGMLRKASVVQKTQYALELLIERSLGRYSGKQFWFDRMEVLSRDFIVNLVKEAEPSGHGVGQNTRESRSLPGPH